MRGEKQITGALGIIKNHEGKFLITRRHQPEAFFAHNKWQLPGGGVEYGEHPRDAVIREIREEVGIEVKILTDRPIIYSENRKRNSTHLLFFCYPAYYKSGELDVTRDEETAEAQWLYSSEIDYTNSLSGMKEIITKAEKFFKNYHKH